MAFVDFASCRAPQKSRRASLPRHSPTVIIVKSPSVLAANAIGREIKAPYFRSLRGGRPTHPP